MRPCAVRSEYIFWEPTFEALLGEVMCMAVLP